jgi:hypothetical protein
MKDLDLDQLAVLYKKAAAANLSNARELVVEAVSFHAVGEGAHASLREASSVVVLETTAAESFAVQGIEAAALEAAAIEAGDFAAAEGYAVEAVEAGILEATAMESLQTAAMEATIAEAAAVESTHMVNTLGSFLDKIK